jgi:hypothetical protein
MKSLCLVLALTTAAFAAPNTPDPAPGGLVSSRIEDRIIKSFDFDERKLGNYESIPRFWRQIRESGYPRFLEPCFDYEVGRTAPPSLRFALAGGNLGAAYLAKDINVHPNADYQVTAWIRPSGVVHARAYVTAYYLDHAVRKIDASERSSPFVQGAGSEEAWVQVSIHLPGGFENARWLGLSCRLEQMSEQAANPDELRPIYYRDIHASAWFDDITILRLPRLALSVSAPGNVSTAPQPLECTARVADTDGVGLDARLDVSDAAGRTLDTRAVPVVGLDDPSHRLTLPDLAAGWYRAVLTVRVCGSMALTREQSFVRLNPVLSTTNEDHRGFGIILDPCPELPVDIHESLLRTLCPGVVKVPLWRREMGDDAIVKGDPRLEDLLRVLHDDGIALVGMLEDPPETLARQCGHRMMTLLDVLCSPPDQWRPYLAFIIARYGPQIRAWQIGGEGETAASSDKRLATALSSVRAELQPLIGPSDLVAPQSLVQQPSAKGTPKADILSVSAPSQVSAAGLARQLALPQGSTPLRRWVTIAPLPFQHYDRDVRLCELARRIITARESGVETIFLRQPWRTRSSDDAVVSVAPDEDFIVYRTLAQALGGLKPDQPIWIGEGMQATLFVDDAGEVAAIAAWTEGDQACPTETVLDVGTGAKRIDMWGNVSDLKPTKGGKQLTVGAMPIIITPVPAARARALAGFAVLEPTLQVTVEEQHRTLVVSNPRPSKLCGTLLLQEPVGWRLQPRKIPLDVAPGTPARIDIAFTIPANQAAGDYSLQGRLLVEGDAIDGLTMRAPLQVRTPGLDVNVMTAREGAGLMIFQRITNRTPESITLQGAVLAAGLPRQTRVIAELAPDQTAVREYRIDNAAALVGKPVRVSVEQIGGPLRHNTLLHIE